MLSRKTIEFKGEPYFVVQESGGIFRAVREITSFEDEIKYLVDPSIDALRLQKI